DRAWIEVGPVGEDDDGSLDVRGEGGEPAAQRRTRPTLPLGAVDALDLQRMRATHDDDAVEVRVPHCVEDGRQQLDLLWRCGPVARRRARGEDDPVDQVSMQPRCRATWLQPSAAACERGPALLDVRDVRL